MGIWRRRDTGGGGGTTDAVARAQVATVRADVGDIVQPLGGATGLQSILASDTNRAYVNKTGGAITTTGTTAAELEADGLEIDAGVSDSIELDETLTAADTTIQADSDGAYGKTDANVVIARVPVGLPVGTERTFIRDGANDFDFYIGDGTVEVIEVDGVSAPDGGVQIPSDGKSIIKKINATTWEQVFSAPVGGGGGGGATTLLGLTDTPNSLTGLAGQAVVVNPTETGFDTAPADATNWGGNLYP